MNTSFIFAMHSRAMTLGQAEDAAVQLENELTRIVREEIGMHEQMASLFAQALVRGLRKHCGGQDLYIPTTNKSARDAAIREAFRGDNLSEIMERFGVSRSTVYRVSGRRDPRAPRIGVPSAKSPVSPLPMGSNPQ